MVARNNGLGGHSCSFLGAWISTPCLIFTARDSVCPFHHTSSSSPAPVSQVDSVGAILVGLLTFTVPEFDAGQRVLEGQGEVAVFKVDQIPSIHTETDRSEC